MQTRVVFDRGKPGNFLVTDLGLLPPDPWRLALCTLAIVWFPPTAPSCKYHPGADCLDNWIPVADVGDKKQVYQLSPECPTLAVGLCRM